MNNIIEAQLIGIIPCPALTDIIQGYARREGFAVKLLLRGKDNRLYEHGVLGTEVISWNQAIEYTEENVRKLNRINVRPSLYIIKAFHYKPLLLVVGNTYVIESDSEPYVRQRRSDGKTYCLRSTGETLWHLLQFKLTPTIQLSDETKTHHTYHPRSFALT